ncbi:alpha-ketoglutarate-dependent dioxygenase AlkB [Ramlibacter sp.]|uniref:alpha-ketoglutarate-dependent dioxygenase AlkB n=1 Tax=Ramlibacter sp. TaxID=1917967 RepID=UPI002D0E638A|nr:alpha-ketoglutarate-dependent dioxygenase AlkB [Ramlibacter sp.]HWI84397.1 alpha-ketoglutarate-dependent dioxygenase AlkB [Ramlibacter sp.]
MTPAAPRQVELFAAAPVLPEGMVYRREFLSRDEEAHLVRTAASLPLREMNYKGYTARRRVASYGGAYDFDANRLQAAQPLPAPLEPLRARVAAWLGVEPEAFTQALVAEYRPGTPLGWHRDVPDFEDVVGVSLLADAIMRFRPYPPEAPKKSDVLKVVVEPRSVYLLRGPSRWAWQHSVAPTEALRYSITFRTPRQRARA